MPTKGSITLYDKNGNFVKERRYDRRERRDGIIEMWRKCYGKKFIEMSVNDTPDNNKGQISRPSNKKDTPPDYGELGKNLNYYKHQRKN